MTNQATRLAEAKNLFRKAMHLAAHSSVKHRDEVVKATAAVDAAIEALAQPAGSEDAAWDVRWFKINRRRVGKSAQSKDLMRYPTLADAERALPLFRADYPNWQVDIFEVAQRRIDSARASSTTGEGKDAIGQQERGSAEKGENP